MGPQSTARSTRNWRRRTSCWPALALEDSQPDQAAAEADAALKISADALDAMAVHASIELLADRSPDAWFARIAAINPTYGEGYALVAHHLILRGRYTDGVAYYRKAVAADPQLWSARAELGVNSDAPGSGHRSPPATPEVLRERLPQCRDGQQPAAAGQLQELRRSQGRHDHSEAAQERVGAAVSLLPARS